MPKSSKRLPLPNAHQGGAFLYIYVMAYTKLPLSITDQIALLKSRGLTFADEVYAAQVWNISAIIVSQPTSDLWRLIR